MAKVIEICGVAGVGKSTIYKEMITRWSSTAKWVPGHFLYPQEKLRFDSLSKLLLSIERKFTVSEGNIDERILKQYGDRFLAKYPKFIDACWNNIFSESHKCSNGSDLRFEKAKYLYITLQKYQFLIESKMNKTTVLDEGLIHRVANGLYRRERLEEELEEIYNLIQLMPLPDLLIYVDTDVEEIAARLYSRKKVIVSHRSLSLAELETVSQQSLDRMAIVLQSLEKRNLPVLHVDAKVDQGTNAKTIIGFLEGINIKEYVA